MHVINVNEIDGPIKVGRGSACNIRIMDITVSRAHAKITLEKGKLFLQDTDSKFGTLIYTKRPIIVDSKKPLTL